MLFFFCKFAKIPKIPSKNSNGKSMHDEYTKRFMKEPSGMLCNVIVFRAGNSSSSTILSPFRK
jgi:hypothetical protein